MPLGDVVAVDRVAVWRDVVGVVVQPVPSSVTKSKNVWTFSAFWNGLQRAAVGRLEVEPRILLAARTSRDTTSHLPSGVTP